MSSLLQHQVRHLPSFRMARREITDEDHREPIRRLLVGMAAGQDAVELSAAVVDLHPKNDTFPGEVYMCLAAEVLADTVAAGGRGGSSLGGYGIAPVSEDRVPEVLQLLHPCESWHRRSPEVVRDVVGV